MSGPHQVVITYEDGRTETTECPCPLCNWWRVSAVDRIMADAIAAMDAAVGLAAGYSSGRVIDGETVRGASTRDASSSP
jgi:hypothetical protein